MATLRNILLFANGVVSAASLASAKSLKWADPWEQRPINALQLTSTGETTPASRRAGDPHRVESAPWELRKNLADPIGTPVMPLDDSHATSSSINGNSEFRQPTNGSTPTGWIQLGTPPKWLFTIFDTGSDKLVAKTWDTISTELASMDQGIAGMVRPSDLIYNHFNSSSYRPKVLVNPLSGKQAPMQSEISYGSGTAVTDEGNETVLVGGHTLENFSLSEITADTLSLLHTKKGVSGVLGLQHMKNRSLGSSLFSRMRDAGLMTSFGYCRGRNNTGTFIWNDLSTEGVEIPVIGEMHWAVTLGSVQVNGSGGQHSSALIGKNGKVVSYRRGHRNVHGSHRTAKSKAWPFSDGTGDGDSSWPASGSSGDGDGGDGDSDDAGSGSGGGGFGDDGFGDTGFGNDDDEESEDPEVDLATLAPHLCPDFKCTAILDTGSNIIAGPTEALKGLTALVNVKSDCSNYDTLPDITMTLGSTKVVVKPAGYVMKVPMPKLDDLDGWPGASGAGDGGFGGDGTGGGSASGGGGGFGNGGAGDGGSSVDGDETQTGVKLPEGARSRKKMNLEIGEPMLPGLHGTPQAVQDAHSAGLTQRSRKAKSRQQTEVALSVKRRAAHQWEAVFAHAAKEYGVDLRTALRNVLRDDNLTDTTELCMPALVPLDKKTKYGPLWVVGTPLLETNYARWSWHQDQESPRIHLKALNESLACNSGSSSATSAVNSTAVPSAGTGPAESAPAAAPGSAGVAPTSSASATSAFPTGLMRSEPRILTDAVATATVPLATVGAVLDATVNLPASSHTSLIHGNLRAGPVERQIDDIRYPHWAKTLLKV